MENDQMEMLEFKNTIKLNADQIGSTVEWAGQRKESELENKIIKITQYKKEEKNRLKNDCQSLGDLLNCNNSK